MTDDEREKIVEAWKKLVESGGPEAGERVVYPLELPAHVFQSLFDEAAAAGLSPEDFFAKLFEVIDTEEVDVMDFEP